MSIKKLIEVALPLDKINEACAREKSIRHGHPSTLHLWWARRPLAAARAVIWSSLVDDPSSHPELFPTEEAQHAERERLFGILEKLVVWENSNNQDVLKAAKEEILKYNHGEFPTLLDPFAGGGAIPLEAQRLGLKAIAHDLNPVAVMINKAMIEIPPRFAGKAPVNPEARAALLDTEWSGAKGLAEDVRYYGEWMKQKAYEKIGYLYPKVQLPPEEGGGEATVIAWIWARTVKCPNPACGCEMPLASSFVLSKKKGKEAWVEPIPDGDKVKFKVRQGKCPKEFESYKVGRAAVFKCPVCGEITKDEYVKAKGMAHEIGNQLMAIVAQRKHERIYLSPTEQQACAANINPPEDYPSAPMPDNPRWFSPPAFGMTDYCNLFTNRQLTALTTLSSLVSNVIAKIEKDALVAGMIDDKKDLDADGEGARAYGEAIGVYLTFGISRMADIDNALCPWEPVKTQVRHLFGRQAIPMLWDYGENNIFNNAAGDYITSLKSIVRVIEKFEIDESTFPGIAEQYDVQADCGLRNIMISTDPPYYDNIGYADLSDFFYIWLRQSLEKIYPKLFSTMLVPKTDELIAAPYRYKGNNEKAKSFFENGMLEACKKIHQYTRDDIPVTIYYAYKQRDLNVHGTNFSGWETMLSAIIKAGFTITGTWPIRTELITGLKGKINALASSIVLVCRKRSTDALQTTRRNFIAQLRRELHPALKKLQESNIAPVDLAQASIGPGMGVFSRYRSVLEADGTEMTVRSALQIINEQVDAYFNEQVGSMDTESRFCVDLYLQNAYDEIPYGEAEILANAKGALIPKMVEHKVLYAKAGKVHLLKREELPSSVVPDEQNIWLLTQQLTHVMEEGGIEACAKKVVPLYGSNAEHAKDLAYRLYQVAEQKGWTSEAFAYNAFVVSWPDIQSKAAELKAAQPEQLDLF